jgi:hypothetical protein
VRIVPYTGKAPVEDLDTLYIIIKAVPFENGFAPAVVIVSPEDDHLLGMEELGALMDGIEIAEERVSEIIDFISHGKMYGEITIDNEDDEEDEEEEAEEED